MALSYADKQRAIQDAQALTATLRRKQHPLKRQNSLEALQQAFNEFLVDDEKNALKGMTLPVDVVPPAPTTKETEKPAETAEPDNQLVAKFMITQALEAEFDYVTWDKVTVENGETFLWRALRFIDEDWFTPLRNWQYWAAASFNYLLNAVDRWIINGVVFGVAAVLAAINVIAEYRRNKHIAEQGKWDVWRARTDEVKAQLLARLKYDPTVEELAKYAKDYNGALQLLPPEFDRLALATSLDYIQAVTTVSAKDRTAENLARAKTEKQSIESLLKNDAALKTAFTEALEKFQRQQKFEQAADDLLALQDKVDALYGDGQYLVVPFAKKGEIRFRFLKKKTSSVLPPPPDAGAVKSDAEKNADNKAPKMEHAKRTTMTKFGEKLLEVEQESLLGKIASTLLTTAKFYAFPYWITWFSLFFIFGIGLIGAGSPLIPLILLFTLPAIPASIYFISRSIRGFKHYVLGIHKSEEEKKREKDLADIKEEELQVSRNVQRAQHYDRLVAELIQRFKNDGKEVAHIIYRRRVDALLEGQVAKLRKIFGKEAADKLLSPNHDKDQAKNDRRLNEIDDWLEGLKGERVPASLRERKVRAVMIGLYTGVVLGSIFSWVATDVMSIAFKLSWASLSYGNIPIAAALIGFIALYTAYQVISNYVNAVHDWNKHADKINNLEKQLANSPKIHELAEKKKISHFEAMRKLAKEVAYKEQLRYRMKKILQELQKRQNSGISDETIGLAKKVAVADFDGRYSYVLGAQIHSDRPQRRGDDVPSAQATASSVFSKVMWRLLAVVDGLGSGSLVVRMFFGLGGICLILFPSIPFNLLIAGIGAGVLALIIASAKLYRYHVESHQNRLTRFADEGLMRASQLEAKDNLLDAQLNFLQEQIEQATEKLAPTADTVVPLATLTDLRLEKLEEAVAADKSYELDHFLLRAARKPVSAPILNGFHHDANHALPFTSDL